MYLSMFMIGAVAVALLVKAVAVPVMRKLTPFRALRCKNIIKRVRLNIKLMETRLQGSVVCNSEINDEETSYTELCDYQDYLVNKLALYNVCKLASIFIVRELGDKVNPVDLNNFIASQKYRINELYYEVNQTSPVGWLDIYVTSMQYYHSKGTKQQSGSRHRKIKRRKNTKDSIDEVHPVDKSVKIIKSIIDSLYEELLDV